MINEKEKQYLIEQVTRTTPLFASYLQTETKLSTYSQTLAEYRQNSIYVARQAELLIAAEKYLKQTFGIHETLDFGPPVYSVVDHHDILNHPLFISPNLISNLYRIPKASKSSAILTLSDAGIPVNHFGNRRGLSLSGKSITYFKHKDRHAISYALQKISRFDLQLKAENHAFDSHQIQFLKDISTRFNNLSNQYPIRTYPEQVTVLNRWLWKELFSENLQPEVPDLYHVPCEVIAEYLLEQLITDTRSIFSKILFQPDVRQRVLELFNGVKGCWSNDHSYGTHLFWGIRDNYSIARLWLSGNTLTSEDGIISIPLTIESIVSAMREKRIYPGLLLTYGMIVLHYGIKPLTGFASTDYLTRMKTQWIKLLEELDDQAEAELVKTIPTNNLIQGPKVVFGYSDNHYTDMYALDIILKGGITQEYLLRLAEVPFNKALQPGLMDVYNTYVLRETKRPLNITVDDLIEEGFAWIKDLPHPIPNRM